MRRSKLEVHLDILKALVRYGPLKLTHKMYKTDVNCKDLKQCLEFLIKQNLVEETAVGKRSVYRITERESGQKQAPKPLTKLSKKLVRVERQAFGSSASRVFIVAAFPTTSRTHYEEVFKAKQRSHAGLRCRTYQRTWLRILF